MEGLQIHPLHVGISVKDAIESVAWYREMLGFELVSSAYMPPLKSLVIFIRNGDFEIELFQHDETIAIPAERLMPNSDIQTQGTKHICFAHSDVVGLLTDLKKKGVDVVLGPQQIEDTIMGFIRDNNGTLIEFIQPAS